MVFVLVLVNGFCSSMLASFLSGTDARVAADKKCRFDLGQNGIRAWAGVRKGFFLYTAEGKDGVLYFGYSSGIFFFLGRPLPGFAKFIEIYLVRSFRGKIRTC